MSLCVWMRCAPLLTFSGFAVYFCCFASPASRSWTPFEVAGREETCPLLPPPSGRQCLEKRHLLNSSSTVHRLQGLLLKTDFFLFRLHSVASFFVSVFPSFYLSPSSFAFLLSLSLSLSLPLVHFLSVVKTVSFVSQRPVALFRFICSLIDGGCFIWQSAVEAMAMVVVHWSSGGRQ